MSANAQTRCRCQSAGARCVSCAPQEQMTRETLRRGFGAGTPPQGSAGVAGQPGEAADPAPLTAPSSGTGAGP
jgi:hypothetical protein